MSSQVRKSIEKSKKGRGSSIKLIVKSNNLVEARYMMNIWEQRLFLMVLSMIGENDPDDKIYRIWYNDAKKTFGLKSNRCYENFKIAATTLTLKPVYLDWQTDDDFARETHTHLFYSADVLKSGQEGKTNVKNQQYADLELGKNIKPHLLEIKKRVLSNEIRVSKEMLQEIGVSGYTSYDMRNVKKLNPYGLRIYELMKKYEGTGFWVTTIKGLQERFGIDNEYKGNFSSFFQVIKKSIERINKYTDIFVYDIKKISSGRRTTGLEFYFKSKTKEQIEKLRKEQNRETNTKQKTLFDIDNVETIEPEQAQTKADILYKDFENIVVKDFGVTPTVFVNMLVSGKYNKQAIEQAIEVTRRAKYKQEIKKSIAGFFVRALTDGFTDEKVEQKKRKLKQTKNKEIKKQKLEQLEEDYVSKRAEKVKMILEQEQGVREKTLTYLKKSKNTMLKKRIQILGLTLETITIDDFRKDKVLRGFFIKGIANEYKEQFVDLEKEYKENLQSIK